MKVLLINDTRAELNPGCQATVSELISFVKANLNNAEIIILPHGNSYDVFRQADLYRLNTTNKIDNFWTRFANKISIFKRFLNQQKNVDFKSWKFTALHSIPSATKAKIEDSNLVIINMEGTIHHNGLGSLTLLGLAYYAKSQGKLVAMVNGTYQEMSKPITFEVLKKIDFLSVREAASFNALKNNIPSVNLVPDFAFRAIIDNDNENFRLFDNDQKKCLYTAGVLGAFPNQKNGIRLYQIINHIESIKELGYKSYYLKIENAEDFISDCLKDLGVETISYEDGVKFTNIGVLISKFDILVTGRYHIGIFGLMSNVATLFLPSNSFKIEGLLKMIEKEHLLIENNNIKVLIKKIEQKGQKQIDGLGSNKFFNSFEEFLKAL